MAETVEATFKATNQAANGNGHSSQSPLPTLGKVTVDEVKTAVRAKSARVATLAKQFSVTEDLIESIIKNPDNGFTIADRGWITCN